MAPTLLLLVLAVMPAQGLANQRTGNLAAKIASYRLGLNDYIIGTRLTPAQKETAASNMAEDSYEGTYKFHDNDLFVVASREDDTVLAIYQRNDEADMAEAKQMISGLMGMFAEPTTMAHDKLIYWAYTEQGKVPEELYNQSRDEGKNLDILATVKFSSSFEITADDPDTDKTEDPDSAETGSIYFIITSDPLVRQFVTLE
jgi:hypothetical protein